jgi:hypothetical protein
MNSRSVDGIRNLVESCELSNSSAVEANLIHRTMSVSSAQSLKSDMLKDHMAMFVQGKDFFSSELLCEIAAKLLARPSLETSTNASHPSPVASGFVGPVEVLESGSDTENEGNFHPRQFRSYK